MSNKNHSQKQDSSKSSGQENPRRSLAEWIAFGLSVLIVAGMIGLIVVLHLGRSSDPAVIEVKPQLQSVREEGDLFYLPVEVENTGGEAAESVWVEIHFQPQQGEAETGQFTISFLASQTKSQGVAVFHQDPRDGQVSSSISFLEP